jgi:hypothetical protein
MVDLLSIRESITLVTSIALADVIAGAVGITRESAQLHLKTIRVAGEITFKGYGRAAADMTPLDASRLVIAVAGSTFAKDSLEVLRRFAKLRPLRRKTSNDTLEDFLARRIAELPLGSPPLDRPETRSGRRFGSARLARSALELLSPCGPNADKLPSYAVVRWLSGQGHSSVLLFGPENDRDSENRQSASQTHGRGTEIRDPLDLYSDPRFFQIRIIGRNVLIDIASALKGIEPPSVHGVTSSIDDGYSREW